MKHLPLAFLLLSAVGSAQIDAIPPDSATSFSVHPSPLPEETLHVWIPDDPILPPVGICWDRAGGFRMRPPFDVIGGPNFSSGLGLMYVQRMLGSLLEDGVFVFSCGKVGADSEAPEGSTDAGLFRHTGHTDWLDPTKRWYYKDAFLARERIDAVMLELVNPDTDEPYGPLRLLAWGGISAGGMCSMRPETGADIAVALNVPISWLALTNTGGNPPGHTEAHYLQAGEQDGVPYVELGDASFGDRLLASIDPLAFQGPVFFGSDFAKAFPSPLNCDPRSGVRNLLTDIHAYEQCYWAFQVRKLTRLGAHDELWVEEGEGFGKPWEREYEGNTDPAGHNSVGVRSSALMAEVGRWVRERLGVP